MSFLGKRIKVKLKKNVFNVIFLSQFLHNNIFFT